MPGAISVTVQRDEFFPFPFSVRGSRPWEKSSRDAPDVSPGNQSDASPRRVASSRLASHALFKPAAALPPLITDDVFPPPVTTAVVFPDSELLPRICVPPPLFDPVRESWIPSCASPWVTPSRRFWTRCWAWSSP